MNTRTRSMIATFIGVTATAVAIVGGQASAPVSAPATRTATISAVRPLGDCHRVAQADYRLCNAVRSQHSYGHMGTDATWTSPNGITLVRDLTHDGLTKAEIHSGLMGEHADYAANVTNVSVDMDSLHSPDCQWIIEYQDADHKPGGTKITHVIQVCP